MTDSLYVLEDYYVEDSDPHFLSSPMIDKKKEMCTIAFGAQCSQKLALERRVVNVSGKARKSL